MIKVNFTKSQQKLIQKEEALQNHQNGGKQGEKSSSFSVKNDKLNLLSVKEYIYSINKNQWNEESKVQSRLQQLQLDKSQTKLQLDSASSTHYLSPKELNQQQNNSSKMLRNYFTNQKQDATMNSLSEKKVIYCNLSQADQKINLKSTNGLDTLSKPIHSLFNNLITQRARKMTTSQMAGKSQVQNSISTSEKQSISQRLSNLKKFYNADGPSINKMIVPKTSYQQFRKSSIQSATSNKRQLNYSHENLDSNLRVKNVSDIVSRDCSSPPIITLQRTPYNQQYSKSTNHSNKPSINYAETSNNSNNIPSISMNKNQAHYSNLHQHSNDNRFIKYDTYNQSQQENVQIGRQSIHQLNQLTVPSQIPSKNNSPQKESQIKTQIVIESSNIRKASFQQQKMSLDSRFDQNITKQQNGFKNNYQMGTENYFKAEILNMYDNSCKKFILCSEFEAHRSYKSDASQAKKVFLQQVDMMQPQLKEMLVLVTSALGQLKDSVYADNSLTEINNLALQSKNGYFQVTCLLLQARVCFEYRDYVKCIHLAKRCKNLAQVYGYYYEKMKAYELIGNAFNALQKHKVSILYQIKQYLIFIISKYIK